jgi:hypothetical protein
MDDSASNGADYKTITMLGYEPSEAQTIGGAVIDGK